MLSMMSKGADLCILEPNGFHLIGKCVARTLKEVHLLGNRGSFSGGAARAPVTKTRRHRVAAPFMAAAEFL